MITVYDFMYLFNEDAQPFEIYDIAAESVVWRGTIHDVPADLEGLTVASIDSPCYSARKTVTINIDTDEE